ncbi:MAG: alpha/beta hydrolase [Paludibacter sp.]
MREQLKLYYLFLIFVASTQNASSQKIVQNTQLKIWPKGIPGSIVDTNYKERIVGAAWGQGETVVEKVSDPEINVFLPPISKATGTAVLIIPGGGYEYLCLEQECLPAANWLNGLGIAAIILKYRLPSDKIMKDKSVGPLQDAQEAMRIIRRNAKRWNVNPKKVGVIGFSAGGHLATTLATHFDEKVYQPTDTVSARPNFSILIYPVISMQIPITYRASRDALLGMQPDTTEVIHFSNQLQITANTPPAFIVHASDDGAVLPQNSIEYYQNLIKLKIPAEMHIYEKGGHGFRLGVGKPTACEWPAACIKWLHSNGW